MYYIYCYGQFISNTGFYLSSDWWVYKDEKIVAVFMDIADLKRWLSTF